jgi:hypothetical protein
MNTDLNFYYSGVTEVAQKLHNSDGESKLRLHLFGDAVNDRFAVAAEKCDQTKLNWLEKKFYVLVPDPETAGTTFYKVNKNSLKKRFQITDKELKPLVQENGTSDQALLDLIKKKHTARMAWAQMKAVSSWPLSDPTDAYSRIIDALVEAGIDQEKYKGIAFWTPGRKTYCFTSDGESPGFALPMPGKPPKTGTNLLDYNKGEILTFICYPIQNPSLVDGYNSSKKDNFDGLVDHKNRAELLEFIRGENSPITLVNLDKEAMEKVMSKGKFPSAVLI